MQDKRNRRPFATGSKPGPDELDHYLEEQGFYRKHVARDASSLFRVVSEQVLDIQNYHDKVRQDCCSFLEAHVKDYANEVDKNFYNYVSNLRRTRTYGTLLELRAMARMFKRNVILFEPNQNYQTTSRVYVNNDEYDDNNPIRVFYSSKDKHFDTIYTMEYVERLAESQAIIYEILYKDVFKLADVKYAVERMLHDQDEEVTLPLPDDPKKYKTASGDIFPFDSADETHCVLKDPKTCHFHNTEDFEEVVNENKDAITIINRSDDPGRLKIFKPIDGFLYNKEKSCVRQLLDEKITPFPYKVAKALDPSIYRNTEFELWSENRKEQRLKWLDVNGLPLKENDDKYFGYLNDYDKVHRGGQFQLRKIQLDPTYMEEQSYITLDEEGKKKYVLVNPSNDDYKLGHLTGLDHFQPSKDAVDHIVMPLNMNHRHYRATNRRSRGGHGYHHNNHLNYITDIEREQVQYQENDQVYNQQPVYNEVPVNYQYVPYEPNSPPMYHNPGPPQYVQYMPTSPFQPPQIQLQPSQNYNQVYPYGYPVASPIAQPTIIPFPPPAAFQQNNLQKDSNSSDAMNLVRENELSSTNVNWNPKESVDASGNDLPMNDVSTLQFYFNLGVRYFFAAGVQRRLESVINQMENVNVNQEAGDGNRNEQPPPVPSNTPVTTKQNLNFGPPGHRFQHNNNNNNNNNNNRRTFNPNSRDGSKDNKNRNQYNFNNNQRKDFQFNSNVKNVHKADTNLNKANSNQITTSSSQTGNSGGNGNGSGTQGIEKTSSLLSTVSSLGPFASQSLSPISSTSDVQSSFGNAIERQQMHPPQLQIPPPQTQYFQQYQPAQTFIPPPPQPLLCFQTETGELMPVQQPIQPIYYSYPTSQTPIYYQTSPQPQQHQQQQQVMDGTLNSTDSGVVDVSNNFQHPTYQQPPQYQIPYYSQPPPIYYPPTPIIQTPHVTTPQLAPVFPVVATNSNASSQEPLSQQSSSNSLLEQTSSALTENSSTSTA